MGFPGGAVVGSLPANAGDAGSSPGLGGSRMPRSSWAREPRLLSLRVWSLCSATGEAGMVRGPRTATKSGPRLPQLEKALAQKRRPNIAINQSINQSIFEKKIKKKTSYHKIHVCYCYWVDWINLEKLNFSRWVGRGASPLEICMCACFCPNYLTPITDGSCSILFLRLSSYSSTAFWDPRKNVIKDNKGMCFAGGFCHLFLLNSVTLLGSLASQKFPQQVWLLGSAWNLPKPWLPTFSDSMHQRFDVRLLIDPKPHWKV